MSFWENLPKPFFALAPMEDVTDTVFRRVVTSIGKPDVLFTEFSHVEAILHGEITRLKYTEEQRPIVAQIWGVEPAKFAQAAKIIADLGFDGIDINLGCPVRDVVKQGACGGLISAFNDQIARHNVQEIIQATKEGGLPVSVKTRIGKKTIITEDWIGFLLEQGLAAITVHGRTVAEQSLVPAHWDEIGKAVQLRDDIEAARIRHFDVRRARLPEVVASGVRLRASFETPPSARLQKHRTKVIGNGDVEGLAEAMEKVEKYGVDGVMIGRGIFHNPWLFSAQSREHPKGTLLSEQAHSAQEKINLLKLHLQLWEETYGTRNFQVMKKFVKMYISGWEGAGGLRVKLMESRSLQELREVLE